MASIQSAASVVWNYLAKQQPLQKADCLIVFGNNDVRTADYAASLMGQGWSRWVCFSGGYGRLSRERFTRPEAEIFAQVALKAGVPEQTILIEPSAKHTGENIQFSRSLFESRGIVIRSALITSKPYLQRRALASCQLQWPGVTFRAAPVQFTFSNYSNRFICEAGVLAGLRGEMQRIMEYPAKGYMIEQSIPEEVMDAYNALCDT